MNNETVYWTMKNGEKIDVDKMTESHLRNTLKMILRKAKSMQETCPHNVEMAIDLAEQENSEPFCDDWMWK